MSKLLPVLRDKYLRSWPNYPDAQKVTYTTADKLFGSTYKSDAHFAAYSVPSVPHRLSKNAIIKDVAPEMVLAVFDVDDRQKEDGVARWSWVSAEREKLDRLICDYPELYIYQTTGGYRIVGTLPVAVVIKTIDDEHAWSLLHTSWENHLLRLYHIECDPLTDWTRLYRLPRVIRDKKPTDGFILGNPANIGVFDPALIDDDKPASSSRQRFEKRSELPHDGILFKLCEEDGLLLESRPDGAWNIMCPLEQEHSDSSPRSNDTVLYPPEDGRAYGNIHCKHTGCGHVNINTPHAWCKLVPGWPDRFRFHSKTARTENVTPIRPDVETVAPEDTRRPIELGVEQHRSVPVVVAQLLEVLAANDDNLYQRDATLARVIKGERHGIAEHGVDSVSNAIDQHVQITSVTVGRRKQETQDDKGEPQTTWVEYEQRKKLVSAPMVLAKRVVALRNYPRVRELRGIVTYPFLTPTGNIVTESGYNAEAKVWAPSATPIRLRPDATHDDAKAAVLKLAELMRDFPFETKDDFAAWLSFPLSILARPSFTDPVPAHLATATLSRSGKGLSLDVATLIVVGAVLPKGQLSKEEDEQAKQVLSYAMPGDPAVIIDNVKGKLGGAAIEALHTGSSVRGRLLGKTQTLEIANHSVWAYSGNQVEVTTDMVGRLVNWRLVPAVELPGERADFVEPDILGYVREHRTELLEACVTVLHAYRVAGFPAIEMRPPLGGYAAWSRAVRAPIIWAGAGDPVATQARLRDQGDTELDIFRERISWLQTQYAQAEWETNDLAALLANKDTAGRQLWFVRGREPDVGALGYLLRPLRDRVISGKRLRKRKADGKVLWSIAF